MALLNQPTVIFTKYTIVQKSIDAVLLLESGWGYAGVLPTCYTEGPTSQPRRSLSKYLDGYWKLELRIGNFSS